MQISLDPSGSGSRFIKLCSTDNSSIIMIHTIPRSSIFSISTRGIYLLYVGWVIRRKYGNKKVIILVTIRYTNMTILCSEHLQCGGDAPGGADVGPAAGQADGPDRVPQQPGLSYKKGQQTLPADEFGHLSKNNGNFFPTPWLPTLTYM
jgi:hypothetical protein